MRFQIAKLMLAICLMMGSAPGPALAKAPLPGPFPITIEKVVDSDSVKALVRIGTDVYQSPSGEVWPGVFALPGQDLQAVVAVSIRIYGIDTPEKRGTGCQAYYGNDKGAVPDVIKQNENEKGKAATAFVKQLLADGLAAQVSNVMNGKYVGRVVADLILPDGQSLGKILIDKGFAVAYFGGTKKGPWCLALDPPEQKKNKKGKDLAEPDTRAGF